MDEDVPHLIGVIQHEIICIGDEYNIAAVATDRGGKTNGIRFRTTTAHTHTRGLLDLTIKNKNII